MVGYKKSELLKLKSQLNSLREELDETSKRIVVSERKELALNKEIDALKRRSNNFSTTSDIIREKDVKLSNIIIEENILKEKINEKETQLQQILTTLENSMKRRNEIDDQLLNLKSRKEATESRKNQVEKSVQSTMEETQEIQSKLRTIQSDSRSILRLEQSILLSKNQLKELQENEELILKSDRENWQKVCESSIEEFKQTLSLERSRIQIELDESQIELTQNSHRFGQLEDSLRSKIELCRDKIRYLEQTNDELTATIPAVSKPLLKQLAVLHQDVKSRERMFLDADRLRRECIQKEDVLLKECVLNERAMQSMLEKVENQIQTLELALRDAQDGLKAEKVSFEKEKALDRERKSEFLIELDRLESENRKAEESLSALQSEIEAKRSKIHEKIEIVRNEIEKKQKESAELTEKLKNDEVNAFDSDESVTVNERGQKNSSEEAAVKRSMMNMFLQIRNCGREELNKLVKSVDGVVSEKSKQLLEVFDELERIQLTLGRQNAAIQALAEEAAAAGAECERLQQTISQKQRTDSMESQQNNQLTLNQLQLLHDQALIECGMKDEQVVELKADLFDIQQMYKAQILHLLDQLSGA